MATISNFTVGDLEDFSAVLRGLGDGAGSMGDAAQRITDHLFANLRTAQDEQGCLGVSLHKTHAFNGLPADLQALARAADSSVTEDTPCLVRMGHTGYEAPDPDPGSIVRPLTASAFEERPIFVELLVAMGLDPRTALDPTRAVRLGLHHQNLDLFLLPDLSSSPWIADEARPQIRALGLVAVLGIGGALPNGDLFFIFFFTMEAVTERSADMLRSLALAAKVALIPHSLAPFAAG